MLSLSLSSCFEPPYTNLNNQQLNEMLKQGVPIYDVRRPEEWRKTGILEGSRLLTFVDKSGRLKPDFLPQFTTEIDKNQPVILICRTGNRTDTLARYLVEKLGYTQVYNARDGITRWIAEKLPVVRP
jgi:rhodanese-related sulfurtransferase